MTWQRIRESFWFIPAALCVLGGLVAEGLVIVEEEVGRLSLGPLDALVYRVGPSGSRDLLGAIAGSVLTVAATSFSITIAVLTLASSTYGPRLVRNFMADRGNQLVLGVYVATFVYSLLVLRSVRAEGELLEQEAFVPQFAVTVALLLALLSIGVLVYFIHHVSDSVQVWTLAQRTSADLLEAVNHVFPDDGRGESGQWRTSVELPTTDGVAVRADRSGYVAAVRDSQLVYAATRHDAVMMLRVRPGNFCVQGTTLATVWSDGAAHEVLEGTVRSAVTLMEERTSDQDVMFAVQQLIEMVVRALSPSTNDPFTAVNALDQVSVGLCALVSRPLPSPDHRDEAGVLRVRNPGVAPTEALDFVFDAIRVYALEHPLVLQATVEMSARVGGRARDVALREHLAGQLDLLLFAFERTAPPTHDLIRLQEQVAPVRRDLLASDGLG
ncbi:MAG: DUF2254 domain-containing protein [Actinomycetota bacterium]|nr:DUF2254 domain-containing protein [Actinomycetota bacterium]